MRCTFDIENIGLEEIIELKEIYIYIYINQRWQMPVTPEHCKAEPGRLQVQPQPGQFRNLVRPRLKINSKKGLRT